MFRFWIVLCFVVVSSNIPSQGFAHSGGLNAQGCHGGSRPYHCHRSPSEMMPSSSGGYRLRCDLGSRSRDCVSGAGAAGAYNASVLSIQLDLQRHCTNLPVGFVDGRMGPMTSEAIRQFQRSYGLTVDGVAGQSTLSALASTPNGRCRINR